MSKPRHLLLILNLLEEGKLVSHFLQTQSCVLLLAIHAHLRISQHSRRDAFPAHYGTMGKFSRHKPSTIFNIHL